MQTRRDQLQAYRFTVRRAIAALVTGEPDLPESPMRRLTVVTLAGVMVAVLVAAGFGLVGLLRPGPSSSWKKDGAIVVDPQGTRYVYLNGKLHPTLNYTSAVLAISPMKPSVTRVSDKSIAAIDRGDPIGLADLPQSLPAAKNLVRSPWTLCALTTTDAANTTTLTTTLEVGGISAATVLSGHHSVLVRAGGSDYLLAGNWRFTVPDADRGRVESALGLPTSRLPVSTDFIAGLPDGGPLRAPELAAQGSAPDADIDTGGAELRVGDVVVVGATTYVLTKGGYAALTPLYVLLFQAAGHPARPAPTGLNPQQQVELPDRNPNLPSTLPAPVDDAARALGVCEIWDADSTTWQLAIPPAPERRPISGARFLDHGDGRADQVRVPNDRAALVLSDDNPQGYYVLAPVAVAPFGRKFAVASADVLTSFDYPAADAVTVPGSLVLVLPSGPALSPQAVRSTGHI